MYYFPHLQVRKLWLRVVQQWAHSYKTSAQGLEGELNCQDSSFFFSVTLPVNQGNLSVCGLSYYSHLPEGSTTQEET